MAQWVDKNINLVLEPCYSECEVLSTTLGHCYSQYYR